MTTLISHAQEYNCADGIDNDNDGLTDCADFDCTSSDHCTNAFPCTPNSTLYQVTGGTTLEAFNQVTESFEPLGIANLYEINGIGFNVQDGYIYGMRNGTTELVKVGNDGVYISLGNVSGLPQLPYPPSPSYFTADFDLSGNLFATNKFIREIQVIDVNASPPIVTNTIPLDDPLDSSDMTYNPYDNTFYCLNNNTGALQAITIDLSTNTSSVVTQMPSPAISCGDGTNGYGASYADNDGNLYFFCNDDGTIYQVNPLT